MQGVTDLPPGNLSEATHGHKSQLEECFLGQHSMCPETYFFRCVQCHLLLSYKHCYWIQGKDLLMWQFVAIHIPNDAFSVDVADTIKLRWLQQQMVRGVVVLVSSHMVVGESKHEFAAVGHDVFLNFRMMTLRWGFDWLTSLLPFLAPQDSLSGWLRSLSTFD